MRGDDCNRRRFLQRTAIGSAIAVGGATAAGAAAAETGGYRPRHIAPGEAETLFEAKAGDLLSALSEAGLLPSADVGDLPLDLRKDVPRQQDGVGTAFLEHLDDRPDQVVVSLGDAETAAGARGLRAMVEPATGRAYAFFEDAADTYRFATIEDGELALQDVDTQDHCFCSEDECCIPWGACTDATVCCIGWGACDTDCGGC